MTPYLPERQSQGQPRLYWVGERGRVPSHCHSGVSLRSCRREERSSSSVRGIQSPRSGGTEREAVSFSANVNEEIDIYERSDQAHQSGELSLHDQGNSVSTIRGNRERGRVVLHQRQRGDRHLREERSSSSVRRTQSPRSGGTEREAVSFSTNVNEEIDIYGRSDQAHKSGGLSRHCQGE